MVFASCPGLGGDADKTLFADQDPGFPGASGTVRHRDEKAMMPRMK
jgi:hypothetical protein